MPLHLLGKKSWHVYNNDNVERVRRDEAQAQAAAEAEEQRMQEEDAATRHAILRGEQPPPLAPVEPEAENNVKVPHRSREPKVSRRRNGEDDTDHAIRLARGDADAGSKAAAQLAAVSSKKPKDDVNAPLEDHAGHVQLIPAPIARPSDKNAEREAEKAAARKRVEDQYTMRFSNAAGFQTGLQKPWYTANAAPKQDQTATAPLVLADVQEKDVWGNEDPRRKAREQARLTSGDPFAAMQQAQQQLKRSEKDRELWTKKQAAEMAEMQRDEQRRKQRRHRRREDEDDLEGFSLDAPDSKGRRERSHHHRDRDRDGHRRHHRRHHHRSRSPSRERRRHSSSTKKHEHE